MAVYPVASGASDFSGSYIPTIFSGKLLQLFYEACVLASISNTMYEGEIRDQGDTVVIRQPPTINTFEYTKGGNIPVQHVETETTELYINKGRGFAPILDQVDVVQSDIPLQTMILEAANKQLKIDIERAIFADIYNDGSAYNMGAAAGKLSENVNLGTTGTPLQLTKANVVDHIVKCGQVLAEQDVPDEDRWMVIPAWMRTLLLTSDLKDASLTGDGTSALRNGRIGKIDGMTLYSSNLLSSVTDGDYTAWRCLFGHKYALTFAAQIVKTRVVPSSTTFGDTIQGLNVYGYKVIKPEGFGLLYAVQG